RVVIARRERFRRVYDLPERVIPDAILRQPPADAETVSRWLVRTRLRQRRVTPLNKAQRTLVEDLVAPLAVEGCPGLFGLREDLPLLDETLSAPESDDRPRLLAPLDPLIYDRKLTARLWDFDYIWEVYTPAAKRQRGYYALPLLSREEIV